MPCVHVTFGGGGVPLRFVEHAQYNASTKHIIISIANLNFNDLTVAALTPPNTINLSLLE